LGRGDEDAFRSLIEPHCPALHAHCYRMLGSLHDAEDALQNTLLRAWRALPKFRGQSSLRNWLYPIATNVCLDAIARRPKRVLPIDYGPPTPPGDAPEKSPSVAVWIEPYQDEMLGSADGDATPEARYERREMLELALIAALQYLSARQRAVFILRDVLGFSAKEVADSLETTVASVNGAVLRARRALEEQLLEPSQPATLQRLGDRRLREIVERFADAFERGEVDAILALLAEDATFASRTAGAQQAGVSAVKGAGPVFDRPGVSADEREPAADQRRSSCGYSLTTDSSPASRSRRSSPTSRRRSPTSGGCGRRGSSERTTPAPTNPVS
jgi:RNA polymerase sigma-70 factor (ECF subfamily)